VEKFLNTPELCYRSRLPYSHGFETDTEASNKFSRPKLDLTETNEIICHFHTQSIDSKTTQDGVFFALATNTRICVNHFMFCTETEQVRVELFMRGSSTQKTKSRNK